MPHRQGGSGACFGRAPTLRPARFGFFPFAPFLCLRLRLDWSSRPLSLRFLRELKNRVCLPLPNSFHGHARTTNTKPSILSLGSLNLDLKARVDCWPLLGESLPARDFLAVGGGKAANAALMARKLGAASVLLARMGDDVFGRMALEPLEQVGVELRHVRQVAGESTGVALIAVGPEGQKTMLFVPNANANWSSEDAAFAEAAVHQASSGSVLVFDLEVPADVASAIARAAREKGFAVVLDPSSPRKMKSQLYGLCDCITPNSEEASVLAGFPVVTPQDALRAGEAIRDRGVRTVFIKLQEGGCVMVDDSASRWVQAPRVKAVDKVGAGDAFAGALATGILAGMSLAEAGRLAVAAATAAVTHYGGPAAYPDRAEVERILACVRSDPLP
jgi:ribokinase